jgi:hypothetical protein
MENIGNPEKSRKVLKIQNFFAKSRRSGNSGLSINLIKITEIDREINTVFSHMPKR